MSSSTSKWIEAISTLNELTQIGQLDWSTCEGAVPLNQGGGLLANVMQQKPIGAAFKVRVGDKLFRITKFLYESRGGSGIGLLSSGTVYQLDILSESGDELFTVPEKTGLADLYKSIQYQVTGIDELLNTLAQEKTKAMPKP